MDPNVENIITEILDGLIKNGITKNPNHVIKVEKNMETTKQNGLQLSLFDSSDTDQKNPESDREVQYLDKYFLIKDSSTPNLKVNEVDVSSMSPSTAIFVFKAPSSLNDTLGSKSDPIHVYYNKKIDEKTYHKVVELNKENFDIIVKHIFHHYTRINNPSNPNASQMHGKLDLSCVNHMYAAISGVGVHLYSTDVNLIFKTEKVHSPYPVCRYYSDHKNFKSNDYEYANSSYFATCSNPLMRKNLQIPKDTPVRCQVDSNSSQISCTAYEPNSTVVSVAVSTKPSNTKVAETVKLESFKDTNNVSHYVISCDGVSSFMMNSTEEKDALAIFDNILKDISAVPGQYGLINDSSTSSKKSKISIIKGLLANLKEESI